MRSSRRAIGTLLDVVRALLHPLSDLQVVRGPDERRGGGRAPGGASAPPAGHRPPEPPAVACHLPQPVFGQAGFAPSGGFLFDSSGTASNSGQGIGENWRRI